MWFPPSTYCLRARNDVGRVGFCKIGSTAKNMSSASRRGVWPFTRGSNRRTSNTEARRRVVGNQVVFQREPVSRKRRNPSSPHRSVGSPSRTSGALKASPSRVSAVNCASSATGGSWKKRPGGVKTVMTL